MNTKTTTDRRECKRKSCRRPHLVQDKGKKMMTMSVAYSMYKINNLHMENVKTKQEQL